MANGTIAFDTLSTSGQISGTAVSVDADYLAYGSAKHWVNINGDTPAARNSLNNASLTDGGNGNYTITRTNNFSSTGYCCQGGGNSSAGGDGRITALDEATLSTSANEIHNRSDANGVQDDLHVNISFLGDLA